VTLIQLYYFLQVCKYGSYSKTAENIHVPQQALSKSIAALEREFDLPLFERTVSGITPTKYGMFLYHHSKEIVEKLDFMQAELARMRDQNISVINLCIAQGIAYFLPSNIFLEFQQLHPNIRLNITEDTSDACERKVLDGEVDAAISIGPFDESKLHLMPLTSFNMLAIVNVNNPLSRKREITFEDLKGQTLISIRNKTYTHLVEQCKTAGFVPEIIFSSYEPIVIYKMCCENNYVGFGAEPILRNLTPHPQVRLIPFKDNMYKREICLAVKNGETKSKALRILSKFLSHRQSPQAAPA